MINRSNLPTSKQTFASNRFTADREAQSDARPTHLRAIEGPMTGSRAPHAKAPVIRSLPLEMPRDDGIELNSSEPASSHKSCGILRGSRTAPTSVRSILLQHAAALRSNVHLSRPFFVAYVADWP